jgi:hypothetical protein
MVKKKSNKAARPGRKRLYGLVTAVVLVVVVVAFVLYYVPSKSSIVKITHFSKTEGSVPGQVIYKFSVTIENQGTNDVSGLLLRVRILGDGAEIQSETFLMPTLNRGQEYSPDEVGMLANLNETAGKTLSFTATLDLNSRTIDEATTS